MNLAKCADAVLTTADLLSGRPTELLYSFCSFGSFLFADSFPRAIFPLSAMTALLFHLSVLVIWKFAISQPVYYRAYDFSDNAGQCTHTHRARFFLSLRRCSLCQNAIRRNTYPGHFRSVSSFHNFCVQSWAFHFAKLVTATLSQTPHCDRTTMQNRQTLLCSANSSDHICDGRTNNLPNRTSTCTKSCKTQHFAHALPLC